MELTEEQIAFYKEYGYLKIENYLSEEEIKLLTLELPNTVEQDSPRIIREDNGSIRSIFAPHFVNSTYDRLSKLRRFVSPAQQLIGTDVYIHQYKINTKKGLKGDWWEWHQDFPYWHIDDGIKAPELVSVMIYLQDTDACNGALLIVPKSHHLGIVKFANKQLAIPEGKARYNNHHQTRDHLSSLNANIKFTIDHSLLKEMAEQNDIVTLSGKKGTVLFFHANIFHASNINLTPFDRDAILITYNSIHNLPGNKETLRPDFLSGRDYIPIRFIENNF